MDEGTVPVSATGRWANARASEGHPYTSIGEGSGGEGMGIGGNWRRAAWATHGLYMGTGTERVSGHSGGSCGHHMGDTGNR